MFELILIALLSIIIAWLGIRLVNVQVELTDIKLKYKFAKTTLEEIIAHKRDSK